MAEQSSPTHKIEDLALAHQMAKAEHGIRGPSSDLAKAMGKTTSTYYTSGQLSDQGSAANGASQAVEERYNEEAATSARELEVRLQRPYDVVLKAITEGMQVSVFGREGIESPGSEVLLLSKHLGQRNLRDLSEEQVRQTERESVAIAFAANTILTPRESDHTRKNLPVDVREIDEDFHDRTLYIENNGSPVVLRAWSEEDDPEFSVIAMPKGGPKDGWDIMRIRRDDPSSKYNPAQCALESLMPNEEDGWVHMGRNDEYSPTGARYIYAFGTSGLYPESRVKDAIQRVSSEHMLITTDQKTGNLRVVDRSRNGSAYRQWQVVA